MRLLLFAVFLILTIFLFGDAYWDIVEASIILLILVLNSTLELFDGNRTEKTIDVLNACSAVLAVVPRDGKAVCTPSDGLVSGDLVKLSFGDRVPIDTRLIEMRSTSSRSGEYIVSDESKKLKLLYIVKNKVKHTF